MAKKASGSKSSTTRNTLPPEADSYRHPTAESPLRPDVGTQANFRKRKPPATYRYDSSLSPALDWDGQNPAREQGEALLREILESTTLESAKAAAGKLKAMGKPFLNWSGKAERLSFDVPTLPLFVHERLSTQAIINTLVGHKRDQQLSLFADPQRSIADQMLKAYEHRDKWVNRMILGDSMVVMDEVFGASNFAGMIAFFKTSSQSTGKIPSIVDYILCYARDIERQRVRQLLRPKEPGERGAKQYTSIVSPDLREIRRMTLGQVEGTEPIPDGWRICRLGPSTSQGYQEGRSGAFTLDSEPFSPPANRHWSYDPTPGAEMDRLARIGRLRKSGKSIATVLIADDNPTTELDNVWLDTGTGSFTETQLYVVQTAEKAIRRCILMSTDPGDLVLDPTCGGGTTAVVAEHWGRRWITADVSRVPLALARQRLLTATFNWYELQDDARGPAGGFVYKRRQNNKREEVGGIVPHITLSSMANNEPPDEEVLVDRPEQVSNITRVTGPFCFEATIPTPVDLDGEGTDTSMAAENYAAFEDRMLEVLRKSPVLHLDGNRTVKFRSIRKPAKTLSLSAEAMVEGSTDGQSLTPAEAVQIAREQSGNSLPLSAKPVAFLFGPENGAVNERSVWQAAMEAHAKDYSHLYVIGFEIQANARMMIENCDKVAGIPATFVKARSI